MAGSERSGVSAANPNLFSAAPCILTPTSRTNRRALAKLSALWRGVGGRPVTLLPTRHDALVAQISHVPHLAAVGLLLAAQPEAMKLAAGGFADTTRVALSDPVMWNEICATNRHELKKALNLFLGQMEQIKKFLGSDSDMIRRFQLAQRKRQRIQR